VAQPTNLEWGFLIFQVSLQATIRNNEVHMLVADSGASAHMSNQVDALTNVEPVTDVTIQTASGELIAATKRGTLRLTLATGQVLVLSNVLGVPALGCTLFSISRAMETAKSSATFKSNACVLSRRVHDLCGALKREKICIPRTGGLYQIPAQVTGTTPLEGRTSAHEAKRRHIMDRTPALEAITV
jgi:hypothetical protein